MAPVVLPLVVAHHADAPDLTTHGTTPRDDAASLSPLERAVCSSLVKGDAQAIIDQVASRLDQLRGPGQQSARFALLSRQLSIAEAAVELLQVIQAQAIAGKDLKTADSLDRLLHTALRRLLTLRKEHAREASISVRTSVVVDAGATVSVLGR